MTTTTTTATRTAEPLLYPPVDDAGWRRRALALAALHTALGSTEGARVARHDEWTVNVADPAELPRWLQLVDALVPPLDAGDPRARWPRRHLRAWAGFDFQLGEQPPVHLELGCCDLALGLPALTVTARLHPAAQALARDQYPILRRPGGVDGWSGNAQQLPLQTWLAWAGTR
jgi:hypothetical protein